MTVKYSLTDVVADRLQVVSSLPSSPAVGDTVLLRSSGQSSVLTYHGVAGWRPPWNLPWGEQGFYRNTNESHASGQGPIADGLAQYNYESYSNISIAHPDRQSGITTSGAFFCPEGRRLLITVNIAEISGWPTRGYLALRRGTTKESQYVGSTTITASAGSFSTGKTLSFFDEITGTPNGAGTTLSYSLFGRVGKRSPNDASDTWSSPGVTSYLILSGPAYMTVTDIGPV